MGLLIPRVERPLPCALSGLALFTGNNEGAAPGECTEPVRCDSGRTAHGKDEPCTRLNDAVRLS